MPATKSPAQPPDHWCFIDESWPEPQAEHVGVLAAVLCDWPTHDRLERHCYHLRRKYYGEDHARDARRELKGRELLSNSTFKNMEKEPNGFSKNLLIAKDLLHFAHQEGIRVSAGVIFGAQKPPLLSPEPKLLAPPFKELCHRLWSHLPEPGLANIVFDQRLGAEEGIAIAMRSYLAGLAQPHRIRPLPLVAVSTACAGLQLADLIAFILGRHAMGDPRFAPWYRLVGKLQIVGTDHRGRTVHGLFRLQWHGADDYRYRRQGTKKEPGASG